MSPRVRTFAGTVHARYAREAYRQRTRDATTIDAVAVAAIDTVVLVAESPEIRCA